MKVKKQEMAYLGDAICQLIVGEYIFKDCKDKEFECSKMKIIQEILTNSNMKRAITNLGRNVSKRNIHTAGTIYEDRIARYYYANGMEKTKEFVVKSLIQNAYFGNANKLKQW